MAWNISILLIASTTALAPPPTVATDTLPSSESIVERLQPSTSSLTEFPALLGDVRPSALVRLQPIAPQSSLSGDEDPTPQLVEYSDAYFTRLTIHKWASYSTLPLFAAEWYLGNKLFNGSASSSTKGAHGAVAASLGVLFAVNTVTGGLNLLEARKDPEGKTLRTIHGLLMLAADAGFAAAGATAPEGENGFNQGRRSTHRAIGIGSIIAATVSYLIMIPPFRRN